MLPQYNNKERLIEDRKRYNMKTVTKRKLVVLKLKSDKGNFRKKNITRSKENYSLKNQIIEKIQQS